MIAIEDKIAKILTEYYDLDVHQLKAIKPGRVYEVKEQSSSDVYIIKLHNKKENIIRQGECIDYLIKQQMQGIVPLIKNIEHQYGTPILDKHLALSRKINGRPIDPANSEEVYNGIRLLAYFHVYAKIKVPVLFPVSYSHWERKWYYRYEQLNQFIQNNKSNRLIQNNRFTQNNKSNGVIAEIEPFVEETLTWSKWMLQYLPMDVMRDLEREAGQKGQMAHLDAIPPNILTKGTNEYFLIDYDLMNVSPAIIDIAQFLTAVLPYQGWSIPFTKYLLAAYNQTNRLTKMENDLLPVLLIYPHDIYREWKGLWSTHSFFHPERLTNQIRLFQRTWDKRKKFVYELQLYYLKDRSLL